MPKTRPPARFDMQKALRIAQEVKTAFDAELTQVVQDSAVHALAEMYKRGYEQAEKDYNLQPRPAGVTEVVEVEESAAAADLKAAIGKLTGGSA